MYNLEFDKLDEILANGTKEDLNTFMEENNLQIVDGKIVAKDKDQLKEAVMYWDKRQLVKKIVLNSLYGALLNQHCRFYDKRMGQSTTLTGRSITRHMASYINQVITGEYDYQGEAIIYGDSVTGDSIINLPDEDVSIEELFNRYEYETHGNSKDYATLDHDLLVLGYNSAEMVPQFVKAGTIMRHKTTKQLYRVTLEDGSSVTVTEDHSLIVDREGQLVRVTPEDLLDDDLLISVSSESD